jgi:fatty acid desaturase
MKGEEFKDDFRKALPRELVQELTRRSTWRATWAVLHDLLILAAAIAVALYFWPSPLIILLAVLVIGTRQHALFVIATTPRITCSTRTAC